MTAPHFPGGTAVTRLSVYDGHGTPHVHLASTEAYVVVGGTGVLHTLDLSGYRESPLRPGATVWFTPGVIHRAVNHGGLEVVVVMSNAGLPEAGDAVMTFPPDILASPSRYHAAATLTLPTPTAVARRRDLAVTGFSRLVQSMRDRDSQPLTAFYAHAAALVRPSVAAWREIHRTTVERQTAQTAALLASLAGGDHTHLHSATLHESPPTTPPTWGMCGHINPLTPPP